jgi:hypothetical protein
MQTSERDIRQTLRHCADGFEMPTEPPRRIFGEIQRRRSKNAVLVGLGSATLVALVAASVFVAGLLRPGGTQQAAVDHGPLVSYVLLDATSTGGGTNAPTWLTDHIACMRAQGFDIPDPTQTADGWSIDVGDPAAIGFGTPAWREAAFVTCALDRPLSGNLILGLSEDRVDAFVTCMAGQGFDLPSPAVNLQGEYVFDLTQTGIDTGRASWDRAAFVTCSPDGTGDGSG